MEMSRDLTKVLPRQCGRNTRGLLYIGKKGCEMKRHQAGGGGTAVVLPMSSPRRVAAFSRDLLDQKSKSLLFPGPRGPVVTND